MGEAALGQVFLDGDAVVADLDLCAGGEGACWGMGDGHGRRGAVGGLLGHGEDAGGAEAGGGHGGRGRGRSGAEQRGG